MNATEGQVAIVSGASRGLGLATTRALVKQSWTVVGDARDSRELSAVSEAVGASFTAIPGDVSDPSHREQMIKSAIAAGGLDLLVNNASILGPSPQPYLDNYPLETFRTVLEVNLVAPLALIQAALPLLRHRRGMVVNITSDAGHEGYPGWGGYGASKAALDQLGNILGAEEPDLAVYRFDPGDMNTRMHQEAFPGEDISDRPDPEQSVPALVAIIEGRPPSGTYRAADFLLAR